MLVTNTLTNWSFKKFKMYRACPMSVKLKYIDRVPEPDPDPKFDEKRQRGIRLHEELANAINDGAPTPPEAKDFADIVVSLREQGAIAEQDEFFDVQWKPWPSYKGHWLQVKKDVRVVTQEYALVGDWKSGRKAGNEHDHYEQMRLYATTEWITNPGLPEYTVELYYLDVPDVWSVTFKPHQLEQAMKYFDESIAVMFADKWFRPKPSKMNCMYCPYGPKRGNGACPVGV